MRTFAQKPITIQQTSSARSTIRGPVHFGQSHEVKSDPSLAAHDWESSRAAVSLQAKRDGLEALSDATASGRFGHDFSRIPVHAKASVKIQSKLAVSTPEDIYEEEADRVSEQLMRMPEPELQRACACGGGCPKCQTEQPGREYESLQTERVQASDTGEIAAPPVVHEVLRSPGQPLDPATRAFMEPRFGHDFSLVRVHSGPAAEQSARDVNAHAYTVGHHIVLGAGRFASATSEGRRLLAHELTHVVQQGRVQGSPTLVQRDSIYEYAREMAKQRDFLRKAALELAKGPTKTERVLEFVGKWGRNASPFTIAWNYVQLNWKGVSYWMDVRKSAKAGRALLGRIDGLERGARALKKATDEQYSAESKLPSYPLQTAESVGQMTVTNEELEYVEKYYNTAAKIANDAMAASSKLREAIAGWDAVVEQANNNNDFTRASAWDAINDLNLRFSNEGGDFRAYLVNARDRASTVESWARSKQYHAADILGKWTPEGYQPPPGPF